MNMDCDYFKSHIKEELDGAKDYAKAALELKSTNPSWSNQFLTMCTQELTHAKNFYDMFIEYYSNAVKPYKEIPQYFRDKHQDILDMYTECASTVKWLQEQVSK